MPVYRPTASCIWNAFRNAFRSSGKRHLILTGGRGSGKTTLLKALFPEPLPGITTWAEPGRAVWLKENQSGQCARVGCYDSTMPGRENKMTLCPEGFRSLGIGALRRCMDGRSQWVTMDEIGYLETGCPEYCDAIRRLMTCKRLAAVVRKQDTPIFREITRREDVFVVDLDAPYGKLGCVIMASGLGTRFGGNKLMAPFRGEPLICRALSATEDIFHRRVVVTRHEDVAALCRGRGMETVLHDLPHRSDTVRLGLEAVGAVDGCLFCPGDQPLLRKETVEALVNAWRKEPDFMWRPAFEDQPGAPILFPNWAFSELFTLPEGKGGGILTKKYPEQVRLHPVRDRYELADVDTQETLRELSEFLTP